MKLASSNPGVPISKVPLINQCTTILDVITLRGIKEYRLIWPGCRRIERETRLGRIIYHNIPGAEVKNTLIILNCEVYRIKAPF